MSIYYNNKCGHCFLHSPHGGPENVSRVLIDRAMGHHARHPDAYPVLQGDVELRILEMEVQGPERNHV